MLIVMKSDATESQVESVLRVIEQLGFKGHPMPGATRTAIGITGNQGAVDPSHFENLAGVAEAMFMSQRRFRFSFSFMVQTGVRAKSPTATRPPRHHMTRSQP